MDSRKLRAVLDIVKTFFKTLECAICLELMEDPLSTGCNHNFCRKCIQTVFKKQFKASCPLCNTSISRRGLHENLHLVELVAVAKELHDSAKRDSGYEVTPPRTPSSARLTSPEGRSSTLEIFNLLHPTPFKNSELTPKAYHGKKRGRKRKLDVHVDEDSDHLPHAVKTCPSTSNLNIRSGFPLARKSQLLLKPSYSNVHCDENVVNCEAEKIRNEKLVQCFQSSLLRKRKVGRPSKKNSLTKEAASNSSLLGDDLDISKPANEKLAHSFQSSLLRNSKVSRPSASSETCNSRLLSENLRATVNEKAAQIFSPHKLKVGQPSTTSETSNGRLLGNNLMNKQVAQSSSPHKKQNVCRPSSTSETSDGRLLENDLRATASEKVPVVQSSPHKRKVGWLPKNSTIETSNKLLDDVNVTNPRDHVAKEEETDSETFNSVHLLPISNINSILEESVFELPSSWIPEFHKETSAKENSHMNSTTSATDEWNLAQCNRSTLCNKSAEAQELPCSWTPEFNKDTSAKDYSKVSSTMSAKKSSTVKKVRNTDAEKASRHCVYNEGDKAQEQDMTTDSVQDSVSSFGTATKNKIFRSRNNDRNTKKLLHTEMERTVDAYTFFPSQKTPKKRRKTRSKKVSATENTLDKHLNMLTKKMQEKSGVPQRFMDISLSSSELCGIALSNKENLKKSRQAIYDDDPDFAIPKKHAKCVEKEDEITLFCTPACTELATTPTKKCTVALTKLDSVVETTAPKGTSSIKRKRTVKKKSSANDKESFPSTQEKITTLTEEIASAESFELNINSTSKQRLKKANQNADTLMKSCKGIAMKSANVESECNVKLTEPTCSKNKETFSEKTNEIILNTNEKECTMQKDARQRSSTSKRKIFNSGEPDANANKDVHACKELNAEASKSFDVHVPHSEKQQKTGQMGKVNKKSEANKSSDVPHSEKQQKKVQIGSVDKKREASKSFDLPRAEKQQEKEQIGKGERSKKKPIPGTRIGDIDTQQKEKKLGRTNDEMIANTNEKEERIQKEDRKCSSTPEKNIFNYGEIDANKNKELNSEDSQMFDVPDSEKQQKTEKIGKSSKLSKKKQLQKAMVGDGDTQQDEQNEETTAKQVDQKHGQGEKVSANDKSAIQRPTTGIQGKHLTKGTSDSREVGEYRNLELIVSSQNRDSSTYNLGKTCNASFNESIFSSDSDSDSEPIPYIYMRKDVCHFPGGSDTNLEDKTKCPEVRPSNQCESDCDGPSLADERMYDTSTDDESVDENTGKDMAQNSCSEEQNERASTSKVFHRPNCENTLSKDGQIDENNLLADGIVPQEKSSLKEKVLDEVEEMEQCNEKCSDENRDIADDEEEFDIDNLEMYIQKSDRKTFALDVPTLEMEELGRKASTLDMINEACSNIELPMDDEEPIHDEESLLSKTDINSHVQTVKGCVVNTTECHLKTNGEHEVENIDEIQSEYSSLEASLKVKTNDRLIGSKETDSIPKNLIMLERKEPFNDSNENNGFNICQKENDTSLLSKISDIECGQNILSNGSFCNVTLEASSCGNEQDLLAKTTRQVSQNSSGLSPCSSPSVNVKETEQNSLTSESKQEINVYEGCISNLDSITHFLSAVVRRSSCPSCKCNLDIRFPEVTIVISKNGRNCTLNLGEVLYVESKPIKKLPLETTQCEACDIKPLSQESLNSYKEYDKKLQPDLLREDSKTSSALDSQIYSSMLRDNTSQEISKSCSDAERFYNSKNQDEKHDANELTDSDIQNIFQQSQIQSSNAVRAELSPTKTADAHASDFEDDFEDNSELDRLVKKEVDSKEIRFESKDINTNMSKSKPKIRNKNCGLNPSEDSSSLGACILKYKSTDEECNTEVHSPEKERVHASDFQNILQQTVIRTGNVADTDLSRMKTANAIREDALASDFEGDFEDDSELDRFVVEKEIALIGSKEIQHEGKDSNGNKDDDPNEDASCSLGASTLEYKSTDDECEMEQVQASDFLDILQKPIIQNCQVADSEARPIKDANITGEDARLSDFEDDFDDTSELDRLLLEKEVVGSKDIRQVREDVNVDEVFDDNSMDFSVTNDAAVVKNNDADDAPLIRNTCNGTIEGNWHNCDKGHGLHSKGEDSLCSLDASTLEYKGSDDGHKPVEDVPISKTVHFEFSSLSEKETKLAEFLKFNYVDPDDPDYKFADSLVAPLKKLAAQQKEANVIANGATSHCATKGRPTSKNLPFQSKKMKKLRSPSPEKDVITKKFRRIRQLSNSSSTSTESQFSQVLPDPFKSSKEKGADATSACAMVPVRTVIVVSDDESNHNENLDSSQSMAKVFANIAADLNITKEKEAVENEENTPGRGCEDEVLCASQPDAISSSTAWSSQTVPCTTQDKMKITMEIEQLKKAIQKMESQLGNFQTSSTTEEQSSYKENMKPVPKTPKRLAYDSDEEMLSPPIPPTPPRQATVTVTSRSKFSML